MKLIFKKNIHKLLVAIGLRDKEAIYLNNSPLIRNIAKFVVNECVVGDYYEFGVYRGQTLVSFYNTIQSVAKKRLMNESVIGVDKFSRSKRKEICNNMFFHAFDSFEGLPELSSEDELSDDFKKGQFLSSAEVVTNLAKKHSMPSELIKFHAGWFSQTCNSQYAKEHSLNKASVIWLDCDLYSSAVDALNIFSEIIQDGTIIVVDDWFNFKGHPDRGVQRAFNEWRNSKMISDKFIVHEYNKDSWSKVSFIVNIR